MKVDIQFEKHRRFSRRTTFLRASIIHPHQNEPLACTVHDISEGGALLDFAQAMDLPSSFWLRVERESIFCLCTVVWRSTYELGVEFKEVIEERRRTES